LILKNSAKTRIASFEIQRTRHKPRPKESLYQRNRKKFLSIGMKGSLKKKIQTKLVFHKVFAFGDHSKENLIKFDYMS
jgi:hypothetical protein